MFHRYFDKVVCLSQQKRKDRWSAFEKEAARIGLDFDFFWAFEMDSPMESFCYSHHAIMQQNQGYDSLLVLEDDCRFQNLHVWYECHPQRYWDMLYFGINAKPYDGHPIPTKIQEPFYQVYSGYTTHAIAYDGRMIDFVADHYRPETKEMYDHWLSTKVMKYFECYVCVPFMAVQAPVHSDLWNRSVDYIDTFKASEEYLKTIT